MEQFAAQTCMDAFRTCDQGASCGMGMFFTDGMEYMPSVLITLAAQLAKLSLICIVIKGLRLCLITTILCAS